MLPVANSGRFFVTTILSVLLGPVLLAQQSSAPSQQPSIFQLEVEYVEVTAIVTDDRGNFQRDLSIDDFTILEDGKPQEIAEFSLVDLPIERAEQPIFSESEIEPDVRSNAEPFDGRVYVMVMDDLHTAVMQSPRVRFAAQRFIQQNLGSNDVASIVLTSGRTDGTQAFTSNRRLLLEAVDKFVGRKIRSQTLERFEQNYREQDEDDFRDNARGRPRSSVPDPLEMERGFHARNALETVRNVAEWMGGIRGRRRALIFLSEGIDYDIYNDYSNYRSTILRATREVIDAAARADVQVYGIDPRGLAGPGVDLEIGSLAETNAIQNPANRLGPTSMLDTLRMSQDSLRVLSDETGGFATVNTNDVAGAFGRIVEDNSSYYTLAYYPSNTKRDGKFRKIQVRVSRPDLKVRARKGYLAPGGKKRKEDSSDWEGPAELRAAMINPLPVSGLTMDVFAASFKGISRKGSVLIVVEMPGDVFSFSEQDGRFVDQVEVHVVALDRFGRGSDTDRQVLNLKLRPATHEAVVANGMRVLFRLDLDPGYYQLRAAAWDTGNESTGTVHYELEVPDFSNESLEMSGLVLTSASASRVFTPRGDEALKEVLPAPPTAKRKFSAGDELALFVDIYDNVTKIPHGVNVTTTIRADDGRVVFQAEDERSSDELAGARGSYGHGLRIPLDRNMAPGLYALRVEARSRLGRGEPSFRELLFRIRGASDVTGSIQ